MYQNVLTYDNTIICVHFYKMIIGIGRKQRQDVFTACLYSIRYNVIYINRRVFVNGRSVITYC